MLETIKNSSGLKAEVFGASLLLLAMPLNLLNPITAIGMMGAGLALVGMGFISVAFGQ